MNLIVWILVGLLVNTLFLKDDLLKNKETLLAGIIVVVVRAIMGGMISNFLFEGGITSIDFPTFTLTGIAPLVLLFIVKIYNTRETLEAKDNEYEIKPVKQQLMISQ